MLLNNLVGIFNCGYVAQYKNREVCEFIITKINDIITYIIPFAFTAYYPASYILRGNDPLFCIGGTVIAAVVMTAISIVIWNKCLASYESAGS